MTGPRTNPKDSEAAEKRLLEEALEEGLEAYAGTVLAVTHDRWFARSFDRFLVFRDDGAVVESAEAVWDVSRVDRAR